MEHINEIDFSLVYVSPMKRCLMTCTEMFKSHPKRAEINFVILPFGKECLHVSNDLCGPLKDVFDHFSKPENVFGIHYDFSLMHCYASAPTWQMNVVADLEML